MNNNKKLTVLEVVQQLMLEANVNHVSGRNVQSLGFVVFPDTDGKTGCSFVTAGRVVRTPDALRRFSVAVRALNKRLSGTVAGIVCSLDVKLDGADPVPSVLIYTDQKFGGVRVWVAPMKAGPLVFRDMGTAYPGTTLLPELFTPEAYGPGADA